MSDIEYGASTVAMNDTFEFEGETVSYTYKDPNMGHYEDAITQCTRSGQLLIVPNMIRWLMKMCIVSVDGNAVDEKWWSNLRIKIYDAMFRSFKKHVIDVEDIVKN